MAPACPGADRAKLRPNRGRDARIAGIDREPRCSFLPEYKQAGLARRLRGGLSGYPGGRHADTGTAGVD